MKKRRRKNRAFILFIILLAISLGYAALSTQLNILGTTSIGRNTWSVFWANVGDQKGVIPTSTPTISDEDATHPNTIVSFGVTLAKVGDYYEFEVDAVNDGTLDAMLSTITTTVTSNGEPATLPPYVTCNITYNDGGVPEAKHLLSKKIGNTPTKERFKIRVEYSRNITISQLEEIPNGGLSYNIELGLSYVQADNTAVARPKNYLKAFSVFSFTAFGNTNGIYKDEVEKIYTMKTKELPSELQDEVIESWDVSANGNSSIIAYALDTDSNSKYEIYLGATGGVKAPQNSRGLLRDYSNATDIDLTNLITDDVENMDQMFLGCGKLINLIGVETMNVRKVTTMSAVFTGCSSLVNLNLSNFNSVNVTNMSSMFSGCSSLTSLNLSGFNTSSVTNMTLMFGGCSSLVNLDLSSFNTNNVGYFGRMFDGCSSLASLDLSSFDTSSATTMGNMFYNCSSLTSVNLSSFNTSRVTSMDHMFDKCSSLVSVDISNFTIGSSTNVIAIFQDCTSLTSIIMPSVYTKIDNFMFTHIPAYNQESFTIPKTVTNIGNSHIFYDFGSNNFKKFIVEEGSATLKTIDDILYSYDGTRLISIPNGKTFTDNAYVMPDSVTTLNTMCFNRTQKINKVVISDNLVIDRYYDDTASGDRDPVKGNRLSTAIYVYTSVKEYEVKSTNNNYSSYSGCIYNKAGTELIAVPVKYTGVLNIKDGTTTIGQEAFWVQRIDRITNITEINIPASVTTIEANQLTALNALIANGIVINIDSNNASYEISNNTIVAKQ